MRETAAEVRNFLERNPQKLESITSLVGENFEHNALVLIPALSSKQRPRDKMNATENIDQSTNSFLLD